MGPSSVQVGRILIALLLCQVRTWLSTTVSASDIPQPNDGAHFDYSSDGPRGPSRWGDLKPAWSLCKEGRQQSPMTITLDNTVGDHRLGTLDAAYTRKRVPSNISHDGHAVELSVPAGAGKLKINNVVYRPAQMHFHIPSEHKIWNHRRVKSVFTVALNVHKEVQRRDISVGRNIGNRILRFLDRMRPQANIRGAEPPKIVSSSVQKKIVRPNTEKSNPKQANPSNKSDHQNPPYTAYLGGHFGNSLRNRFSSRFGSRSRPPSIPVISMGLLWQPVRKNMAVSLSREASPAQVWRSDFSRLPRTPLTHTGFATSLIREDIAALIRRPQ